MRYLFTLFIFLMAVGAGCVQATDESNAEETAMDVDQAEVTENSGSEFAEAILDLNDVEDMTIMTLKT